MAKGKKQQQRGEKAKAGEAQNLCNSEFQRWKTYTFDRWQKGQVTL